MHSVGGSIVGALILTGALGPMAASVVGQAASEPLIEHEGMASISSDEFSELEAYVTSDVPIVSARLHFRAVPNRDFHFVLMENRGGGRITGVPPVPNPTTEEVEYFIEVISESFGTTRSEVYTAPARPGPSAYPYVGAEPEILIGKVREVGPALPPGFQVKGVVGILGTAAAVVGGAAAATSGVGLGTAVIAGTAAAGAVGGVALTVRDNTVDPPPPLPTIVSACFEINPPVITVGDTVRFNAGCSTPNDGSLTYTWGLGDGRPPRQGPSISLSYRTPDTYTIELTVTDGTQSDRELKELVVRPGELKACFTVSPTTVVTGATITLDGRCSRGDITNYQWDLGDGRLPQSGPFLQTSYAEPGEFGIALTVSDGISTDRTVSPVTVERVEANLQVSILESNIITVPGFGPAREYVVETRNLGPQTAVNVTLKGSCTACGGCAFPPTSSSNLSCQTTGGQNSAECLVGGPTAPNEFHSFTMVCGGAANNVNYLATTFSDTYDGSLSNNTVTRFSSAGSPARSDVRGREVTFTSSLEIPPHGGGVSASVSINSSRTFPTNNAAPFHHRMSAKRTNIVEGVLVTEPAAAGLWRFDFSNADNLVTGSLRPELGDVMTLGGRSIVFRLKGHPGERVKFRFDLTP